MRRLLSACSLLAVLIALSPNSARAVLSEDDFFIKHAQDLVDLCAADAADPLYSAAIHFCHGFASGAWQFHEAQATWPDGVQIVCAPEPPPTRNEAIAGFVTWAAANPQHMNEPAIEGLFRFLNETWPCSKGDSK